MQPQPHDQEPAEAPASGQVLSVAPDGGGTHRALAAALDDAEPGATIRLAAGAHRLKRGLLIRKGVTLIGEGMDLTEIVCDRGEFALRFNAEGRFVLRDLAVKWEGPEGGGADVVSVLRGDVLVEDCRLSGATNRGEDQAGAGIEIKGKATGIVRRCQMHDNGYGIAVGDSAQPLLEDNTCRRNTFAGIAYYDTAGGTARRNACLNEPQLWGIYVFMNARPTLENNTGRANKWSGIGYFDRAGGRARGNVCDGNGLGGIIVANDARPELDGNTCRENTYIGIVFAGRATGVARANTCAGNGLFGIWSGERSRPRIENNICERNPRAGIYVTVEAWPTLPNFPGWDMVRRPHA